MKKLFLFNLAVMILFTFQTEMAAQKVDSLFARMTVSITSLERQPDRDGVIRIFKKVTTDYSTELIMQVGLPLSQIDDGSRYEGNWNNIFVVGGESYKQYYNYSKSTKPVYTRQNPLKIHKVIKEYGFRHCDDPAGPDEWGLMRYTEFSDVIPTQYAEVYLRPYDDPALASLTSNKPTQYVMVIRGPTVIAEMVKRSEIQSQKNQLWDTYKCKMEEQPAASVTSAIPVEDIFSRSSLPEDKVSPPLVSADLVDNYLDEPKGILSLSLSGSASRMSDDGQYVRREETAAVSYYMSPEPFAPAEVKIDGCTELATGEFGTVTATGKPEGGQTRFWCEPDDMFDIKSDGASSVVIKGVKPGHGTFYAEYTDPDGNTAKASQQAICSSIENYNGGAPVPPIPLFDINGKRLPGVLKVPVTGEPSKIEELVDFVPDNNEVLTANGSENSVELHGLKQGKTIVQAKTSCGNPVGPAIDVEVVNCDKETVEALERMRKAAVENLQDAASELQKLSGSKEFEKARDDLVSSTVELLAKAGLTIISSGENLTRTVKTASELAEAGAAISELIGSGTASELGMNALKNAAGQLGGDLVNSLVGVVEVGEAGYKFGQNVGQILRHESAMKGAMENFEQAMKNLREVERLQRICKGDKTGPKKQDPPKADPQPQPDDPKPTPSEPPVTKKPKPTEDTPPVQEPTGQDPTPGEPGEKVPPDEPPTTPLPPTPLGLPSNLSDCGCEKKQNVGITAKDISVIQEGTRLLGDCAERFNKTSVIDYTNALNEYSELTKSLQSGAKDKPELFLKQAKDAKPQLDSLILRVREYDEAGKTFLSEFEKCPESVKAGMDVLESALKVTIDSIKTKY